MTLIVEDGSGLSTSESYISVSDADARHTALGNTAWTGADAVKESALRRATQYMTQAYRQRWKGTRLLREQALDWPRYGVFVDNFYLDTVVVPDDVANACADLALRALTNDLAPDTERAVVREKVGPLETEYAPYAPQSTSWTAINMALAPYMKSGGVNVPLVRL